MGTTTNRPGAEERRGIPSDRARCRHCAAHIYRRSGSSDPWRHSDTGLTTCVDLTGHDRKARPTRQYEEANR